MSARQRVRSRISLAGTLGLQADDLHQRHCVRLHLQVTAVQMEEHGQLVPVAADEYRAARPDPLHEGAAEQLQHLDAHHQDAIVLLSRLCGRAALTGATRVLPLALDRYGLMLRVERLRGHTDVRLGFRAPVDTGVEAVAEMRHLFTEAGRRRACQPVTDLDRGTEEHAGTTPDDRA